MVSWEFSNPNQWVPNNNGLMGTRPMPIKVTGFLWFKPKTKRQTKNSASYHNEKTQKFKRNREYSLPATPAASLQIVITEDETERIIKRPSTPTLSIQSSNQTQVPKPKLSILIPQIPTHLSNPPLSLSVWETWVLSLSTTISVSWDFYARTLLHVNIVSAFTFELLLPFIPRVRFISTWTVSVRTKVLSWRDSDGHSHPLILPNSAQRKILQDSTHDSWEQFCCFRIREYHEGISLCYFSLGLYFRINHWILCSNDKNNAMLPFFNNSKSQSWRVTWNIWAHPVAFWCIKLNWKMLHDWLWLSTGKKSQDDKLIAHVFT
jgi:hypothetical protein